MTPGSLKKYSFTKNLLFLLWMIFLSGQVTGQVTQTQRYEREQKNSNEHFTIVSLKEEGVALYRDTEKYNGNKKKWELIILDTALQEKHNLPIEIEERHTLLGYEYVPGHFFLLYRMGDNNKNKLELIDIDIATGAEVLRTEIKTELDFKVTHFSKVGNHLVLGGYVQTDPAVLLYSLDENHIKVLPGFFQKDSELIDIRVNQNLTFNALLIDRSVKTDRKLLFRTFDENGNMLLEASSPVDEHITLQTSISSTLEREDLIVMGTWGPRTGRQSSGVFTWTVDPFEEQPIKYLHFGELNKFIDYLSPKRAKRIKEKTKETLKEGRKPDFTAYAMPFKIIEHQQGFLLVVEVYDPQSSAPYYSSPYYNNPYLSSASSTYWPGYYPGMRMYRPPYMYGNNVKNTDQIRTLETAVISFDPSGKLLWDESLKLDDMSSAALEQEGDCYFEKGWLTMIYKKESELKIKQVEIESGSIEEKTEKIKLNDPGDEIRSEQDEEGGLSFWIGKSFYVWGYQTLRNTLRQDRVRDVFYINKVTVH
jgi:hypothetical protein